MYHPFALKLSQLEAIDLEIQDITNEEAKKVAGGASNSTTLALGEEGGGVTTFALGEEGGATTQALGEEGGFDPDAI